MVENNETPDPEITAELETDLAPMTATGAPADDTGDAPADDASEAPREKRSKKGHAGASDEHGDGSKKKKKGSKKKSAERDRVDSSDGEHSDVSDISDADDIAAVDGEAVVPTAGLAATSLPLFLAPPPLPQFDAPATARPVETDDEVTEPSTTTRRRTRSRSRGRAETAEPREPQLITEPQRVKGSTRLEAKKQRRRDGRDAGRRRTVVTEAEFLARRESVDRVMVVRSRSGRIQIGVLEDGILVEHYVARSSEASLIGNVYLGKVQNVLPSMEAAFVDIGRGRNAVLYSGEVDWDAAAANAAANAPEGEAPPKNQARRIELALKAGDRVLVQVTKDPVGHKGARLTSQISLPGRFLVYVPSGSMSGISRKLPDTERSRLKKILKEIVPDDAGVIVRTAAEGATEEQLGLDVKRLQSQWEHITQALAKGEGPKMLHSEPDLLVKIIRDVFNEDFTKLVVSGDDALSTIADYLGSVAPDLMDRLERYEGAKDAFDEFRISEQIDKALERKVWLPSGGSLVIDRTEAMTVVDVNTGKFVGSGGNLEETVTKNNLEAAEEIVRQLRLRDIGGIIVIDFIDMVLETNRDLVLRRLVECLSRDRTKHQVAEVTSLGLVQMTRKKLGLGLLESFSESCEVCAGRGVIVQHEPVFKHRSNAGSSGSSDSGASSGGSSRRRRGGQSASSSGAAEASKPAASSNGTHALTGDVLNAIAQIAKGTVHADVVEAPAVPIAEAPTTPSAAPAVDAASGDATPAAAESAPAATSDAAPTAAPRARRSRRASTSNATPAAEDAAS